MTVRYIMDKSIKTHKSSTVRNIYSYWITCFKLGFCNLENNWLELYK